MIRTIISGSATDAPVLTAAATVARAFDAYVHAIHPRFDPAAVAKAAGEAHPERIIADLVQQLGRNADAQAAKAKAAAEELCTREGLRFVTGRAAPPSVQWRIVADDRAQLEACGMAADLAVAPPPNSDDPRSRRTFNTLLFDTGRPVLMPCSTFSDDFFRHVAVAWKPTPQAARALVFAIPFLARAAAVTVLVAEENKDQPVDLEGIIAYLGEHGVKAEGQRLVLSEGGAGAAVLRAAQNPSLLVMGAYGHSRMGEWIFGGFTRTLVQESPAPLLMTH